MLPEAFRLIGTAMKLLRLRQVCATTGLSRSVVYELMKRGEFPKSVRISTRSVAWRSTDVDAWLNSRPVSGDADTPDPFMTSAGGELSVPLAVGVVNALSPTRQNGKTSNDDKVAYNEL